MCYFCVFMANESCSNANKLACFNDVIKVYDARRIFGLLVLGDWLIPHKNTEGGHNYFSSFMKIGIFVNMIFLQHHDLWSFLLSRRRCTHPWHLEQKKKMFFYFPIDT